MGIGPAPLLNRWLHSHEEDAGAVRVYRPATTPLPPARGRSGFELLADGTAVVLGVGHGDRPAEELGRWRLDGDRLTLSLEGAGATFQVVEMSPGLLRLRPE